MPTPMPRLQPRGAAAAESATSPALANLSHVATPPPPPELETHRRGGIPCLWDLVHFHFRRRRWWRWRWGGRGGRGKGGWGLRWHRTGALHARLRPAGLHGTAHAPGHALPNAEPAAPGTSLTDVASNGKLLPSLSERARGTLAAAASTAERAGARYPLAAVVTAGEGRTQTWPGRPKRLARCFCARHARRCHRCHRCRRPAAGPPQLQGLILA